MMNLITDLNKLLASESAPVAIEDRKACVEYSLAVLIATTLPLPSAPVESVVDYYAANCVPVLEVQVDKFNTSYPLNLIDVQNSIYHLWRHRYEMVHPQGSMTTLRLYASLPADLAAELPPTHVKAAGQTTCMDAAGLIKTFLDQP